MNGANNFGTRNGSSIGADLSAWPEHSSAGHSSRFRWPVGQVRQAVLGQHGGDVGCRLGIELPTDQHDHGQGYGDWHEQRVEEPGQCGEGEVVAPQAGIEA